MDAIARLRGLLDEATTRPWVREGEWVHVKHADPETPPVAEVFLVVDDADLIVAAVNHLDRLLRVAEAARLLDGDLRDGFAVVSGSTTAQCLRAALRGLDDGLPSPGKSGHAARTELEQAAVAAVANLLDVDNFCESDFDCEKAWVNEHERDDGLSCRDVLIEGDDEMCPACAFRDALTRFRALDDGEAASA